MERRKFLQAMVAAAGTLTLAQAEGLLAAAGFHGNGPYNGPLLTSYINTTCGACPGGCGIRVRKVDRFPVKIDGNPVHPISRGGLCPVGVSALAYLTHRDRVRQPLMRTGPRGSGEYRQLSWGEAHNLLLSKLKALKDAGTPEQLLYMDSRTEGPGYDLARAFVSEYGSPNFFGGAGDCAAVAAEIWGGDGTRFTLDLENAHSLYCFGLPVFEGGANPVYYTGLRRRYLDRAEGLRGKFIVIDPRMSASAAKAERWVPIKPNQYGTLALGMLYLIIKERLYDAEGIKRVCVGFEDAPANARNDGEGFRSYVLKNYYPSRVSEETGVPVDQIITLARSFATTPGAIAIAGTGVCRNVDGVYQAWSVMALNAVMGRLGVDGGVRPAGRFPYKKLVVKKTIRKEITGFESERFPYHSGSGRIESLPDGILSANPYPIKVAIINNVNVVYDSPQSDRFRQALQNIPFSVAITTLKNETSALADLILPDCSFLEKYDLVVPQSDFMHPVLGYTQPVIEPLYESRQCDDVTVHLAAELFGDPWKGWKNYRGYLESKLREIYESNAGTLFSDRFKVSFESLLAARGWKRQEYNSFREFSDKFAATGGWWDPLQPPAADHSRIPSTSGKFYFHSEPLGARLKKMNTSLPELMENTGLNIENGSGLMPGSYRERPDNGETRFAIHLYPFELTTTRGDGGRFSAMADMIGYYQNLKWRSWVELSPETAEELGLSDGQLVWLESARGRQRYTLLVNPALMSGVAAVPVGAGKQGSESFGRNVGDLLVTKRELFTGMPATSETRVRIYS